MADGSRPIYCDRCGPGGLSSPLTSYSLGNDVCWLCAECELGIVVTWLAEHEAHIKRARAKRASTPSAP